MIGVKVTEDELRRIRTEAARHNQTIGAYVRDRLADVIATKPKK